MRNGYTGRPFSRFENSVPPSSIIRNIGTHTAESSTIPMRSSGSRSRVPFRMRSVHASAAARPEEDRLERRKAAVVGHGVPHVVEHAALIGDVEHRRDAVVHERAPDPVVVGMRKRTTVDERGRDHRQVHTCALEGGELAREPLVVAHRQVRDGMHAARDRRPRPNRTNGSTRSCSR